MKINWPLGKPQVIPNFPLTPMVQNFVRRGPHNMDKAEPLVIKIADSLWKRFSPGDFRSFLQLALNTALSIDGIKQDVSGFKGSTKGSNLLIWAILTRYVALFDLNRCEVDWKYLERFVDQLKGSEGFPAWHYPKISNLQHRLENKKRITEFARNLMLPTQLLEHMMLDLRTISQDVSSLTADIVGRISELRKYGVKNCYFQDGMLHHHSDAWVFMDPNDFDAYKMRISKSDFAAMVALSAKRNIEQVRVEKYEDITDDYAVIGGRLLFNPLFFMGMNRQGELDATGGSGLMPVRDIFAGVGNETGYEIIRLAQAMRLFDLVVPIYTVNRMPRLPKQASFLQEAVKKVTGRRRHLVDSIMLIPRIRSLEKISELVAELEYEWEQAEKNTGERSKKRRHQVTGFVRPLPEGHKASAEARRLAWEEQGIILDEGETYVRKHERGEGEWARPTRAKRR